MPTSKNFSVNKLGQKGITHIVVLIILAVGFLAGLYLVQHPTIFKPKAYEPLPPVPTACNARIASISLADPCNEVKNGFRSMKYSCSVGGNITSPPNEEAGATPQPVVCKSMENWARTAQRGCSSLCPVPTPTPCQPRPACLDASPACAMPEPAGGWCPVVSPTPFPTPVPLSYTCNLMNDKINASFGTTCGDSGYDPVADVNKDKSVTILDFSTFRASSTDEVACKKMYSDTTNPCSTP